MEATGMGKFARCAAVMLSLAALVVVLSVASAGENQIPPNLSALFGGSSQEGSAKTKLDAEALRALLSKERNVIIEEQGDLLVVDGRVSSQSAQKRLAKILERYDNILDLTEFIQDEEAILARADYLKQKIEERLNRTYDLAQAFVPKQQVAYDIVENEVVIVGELNNQEDVQQVSKIITTYEKGMQSEQRGPSGQGGDATTSAAAHLTVSKVPLDIDIIFARMSSNDQRNLGLSKLISGVVTIPELIYAPTGSGGTNAQAQGTSQGVFNPLRVFNGSSWTAGEGGVAFSPITLSINELESNDRILSRPHLSTINGTAARFHAGGQMGIRLVGSDSSSVEWKDYGTILTATPTLTSDGRVHMKLTLEVTTPTAAPDGGDVGFTRFEHESEAIVSANQGMVLSGIVRNLRSRGGDGIPGLRKLPIFGYFFGSRNRTVDSEELVIVAIPRFTQVINDPTIGSPEATSRIINGVLHDIRGDSAKRNRWKRDGDACDTEYTEAGQGWSKVDIQVDVLPHRVTSGESTSLSPSMQYVPQFTHPAPQNMDFMQELVPIR